MTERIEAMIDWEQPIESLDGKKAKFVGMLDCGEQRYVVGINRWHKPPENALQYQLLVAVDNEGRSSKSDRVPCIRNKPKLHATYLNCYGDEIQAFSFIDRSEADESADPDRTACIRVEWEDGQYDD